MISFDRKLELGLIAFGVLVAIGTGIATMAIAAQSKTVSEDALRATQVAAWDYSGAQNCTAYRSQVLDLWKMGVSAVEIRKWFEGEAGGAQNPYAKSTNGRTAADDLEAGCGSVKSLVDILPKTK
jgi:hypothetical protein